MLEKQITKTKKNNKKKYIGILLLYHFSPSLIRRKNNPPQTSIKSKPYSIIRPKINSIKLNNTRLLLKEGKYFYTIDYICRSKFSIKRTVKQEMGIKKKYIDEVFVIDAKRYDIYVVILNTDIPMNPDSEYKWKTYIDFFKDDRIEGNFNDVYDNILQNDPQTISISTSITNSHLNYYLFPDNNNSKKIIKIRDVYKYLIGREEY